MNSTFLAIFIFSLINVFSSSLSHKNASKVVKPKTNQTASTRMDRIIFPDDDYDELPSIEKRTPTFKVKTTTAPSIFPTQKFSYDVKETPKCSKGRTFCEEADNYPLAQIRRMKVSKETEVFFRFGSDELNQRVGDVGDAGENEVPMCHSVKRLVFPKYGMDRNNKWKFIVNDGKHMKQGVIVEYCKNEDEKCDSLIDPPLGYTTRCVQKYMDKLMVALDEKGDVTKEYFKLPVACCCVLISYHPERKL